MNKKSSKQGGKGITNKDENNKKTQQTNDE